MPFLLRLLRHILMEACQLRRRIWHMILTSFGMRKFTALSAIAVMFSRISCIDISLLMTVTVTVTVHAFDTWTYDASGQTLYLFGAVCAVIAQSCTCLILILM